MIKKLDGKYFVYSHDGNKRLSAGYDSREDALKRLRQIEFYKRKDKGK